MADPTPAAFPEIKSLTGGNFELDLIPSPEVPWKQDSCPWNEVEGTTEHRCAVKNTSICKYFCGLEYPDTVRCSYPHPNPLDDSDS